MYLWQTIVIFNRQFMLIIVKKIVFCFWSHARFFVRYSSKSFLFYSIKQVGVRVMYVQGQGFLQKA